MYKFIGGFINTLQPYNNTTMLNLLDSKLILTENFLNNIDLLLLQLRNLQGNIDKSKLSEYIKENKNIQNADIEYYIKFCNTKNINLFTLTEEQLLESGDMKDKYTLINRNNYFYQIYDIRNKLSKISNEDFNLEITKLSEINDVGKFKKQIQDKITELETIKIKTEDLLKINCF
jgi:hypothetical protein